MNRRFFWALGLAILTAFLFSFKADAATAVTIAVEAGPALTEGEITEVVLIVPKRPTEALPLNVGDKVFFEAFEPLLEGEGTITDGYETEDETITQAIILDHVHHE